MFFTLFNLYFITFPRQLFVGFFDSLSPARKTIGTIFYPILSCQFFVIGFIKNTMMRK